jgi:hypothetical protein
VASALVAFCWRAYQKTNFFAATSASLIGNSVIRSVVLIAAGARNYLLKRT